MKNGSTEIKKKREKAPNKPGGSCQIGVRVGYELRRQLEALSAAERRTLSQLGEMAIEEFVNRHQEGAQ